MSEKEMKFRVDTKYSEAIKNPLCYVREEDPPVGFMQKRVAPALVDLGVLVPAR